MHYVRLRINLSGTYGNQAWEELQHFSDVLGGEFGPDLGSSGACDHPAAFPHPQGEWCAALIEVETHLLAEYAVAYYLEQPLVIDALIEAVK